MKERIQRRCLLLMTVLMLLMMPGCSGAENSAFSVKRIGNLIPFNDNQFQISAPENGKLTIRIHDDLSVYRILSQDITAGETSIHWDGCAFNHEKLAAKDYTVTAELEGASGDTYQVSFHTPVEYTGQCLQYALPSSDKISLSEPDEWFIEYKTVQKGNVKLVFRPADGDGEEETYTKAAVGGKIYRISYSDLTAKKRIPGGEYTLKVFESTKPEECFEYSLSIQEDPFGKKEVSVTGEILPERNMTEEEIWQMMQQPSVVADIDFFSHQKVYENKDPESKSLGTLHGQTQALKVIRIDGEWCLIGAWNHEEGEYVEGWVPLSVLKVTEPSPDYGLLIDKKNQTMDVYCRGKRIETLQVSTGRAEKKHSEQETAAGSFLTGYHRVDFSMNGKKYDYVIQYDGGNLLHQIPYEWGKNKKDFSSGRGYLGAKASHACIRIQAEPGENGLNAYWLWTHLPYHTRVLILDDPEERRPSDRTLLKTPEPDNLPEGETVMLFDSGEAENRDNMITIKGHQIGFADCSEKEYLKNPETVTDRVREMKEAGCEKIILRCSWNNYQAETHSALQEAMARKGAKAGADLVIGIGSKNLLGCECFNGCPILYGLGTYGNDKKAKASSPAVRAEAVFDFTDGNAIPVIRLSLYSGKDSLNDTAECFAADSVGDGLRYIQLCTTN